MQHVVDWNELLTGLMKPRRPQLGVVRQAVEGAADGRSAWDALVHEDLVPTDAFQRQMYCVPCGSCPIDENGDLAYSQCPACSPAGFVFAYPRSVAASVTLASDPEGVTRAEALAQEAARRLRLWNVNIGDGIRWQVESLAGTRNSGCMRPPLTVVQANARAWMQRAMREAQVIGDDAAKLETDAFVCWQGQRIYDALMHEGVEPYATRPNPYTPLVEILQLGYTLRRVDEEGTALVAARVGEAAAVGP